jgi:hypothetical protein
MGFNVKNAFKNMITIDFIIIAVIAVVIKQFDSIYLIMDHFSYCFTMFIMKLIYLFTVRQNFVILAKMFLSYFSNYFRSGF